MVPRRLLPWALAAAQRTHRALHVDIPTGAMGVLTQVGSPTTPGEVAIFWWFRAYALQPYPLAPGICALVVGHVDDGLDQVGYRL